MGAKKGQKHFQIFAITMAHFLVLCGFMRVNHTLNHMHNPITRFEPISRNPVFTGFLVGFMSRKIEKGAKRGQIIKFSRPGSARGPAPSGPP